MKKLTLAVGVGIGFVLGSRAGHGPYEKLEAKVRGFVNRDDVQSSVSRIKQTANDQAASAVETVSKKLPGDGGLSEAVETSTQVPEVP